jgi:hypothetical protein
MRVQMSKWSSKPEPLVEWPTALDTLAGLARGWRLHSTAGPPGISHTMSDRHAGGHDRSPSGEETKSARRRAGCPAAGFRVYDGEFHVAPRDASCADGTWLVTHEIRARVGRLRAGKNLTQIKL